MTSYTVNAAHVDPIFGERLAAWDDVFHEVPLKNMRAVVKILKGQA